MQTRGLDLSQHHGARAVGPCGLGDRDTIPSRAPKGATNDGSEWPSSRPIHYHAHTRASQTYGLCTLGLFLFKAAGLVQAVGLPAY